MLDYVGCIVRPAGHPFSVAVQNVFVPSNQNRVSLLVASQYVANDLRVIRFIGPNAAFRADPGDLLFANKTISMALGSQLALSLAEAWGQDYLGRVKSKETKTLEGLPTPALVLDLDVLESNLRLMQGRADALGVRLRPHVKTHKCLEIGDLQRSAGASGITVSTPEEARAFAAHGVTDILWAFPMIPSRLREILDLSDRVRFGVTVDSLVAVETLSRTEAPLSVWIELDCGYGRSGVPHESPALIEIGRRISETSTLELAGCLTHAGHTYHAESPAHIVALAEEERRAMVEAGQRLREAGVDPGTLSVGSTPGMSLVQDLTGIDEVRPGNYALYDYTQVCLGSCGLERCAVTVLATVISSHPGRGRCVADCGAAVLSKDLGAETPAHFGRLFSDLTTADLDPAARVTSVSQEHGTISTEYSIGTKIRILPNHACLTVAQFDHFDVVRGQTVVDRWKIWRSRGAGNQEGARRDGPG